MGDTGSLTIGGIIAVPYAVRKELLILLCGVFFSRLSVVQVILNIQKTIWRKAKNLLMAPYIITSKRGYHESKIVTRF
jgi:UDP-N-acetylmuramyl pentapeptide phosphotransferase/UDP-N-acetylglucosamine-1-phosphate transferase